MCLHMEVLHGRATGSMVLYEYIPVYMLERYRSEHQGSLVVIGVWCTTVKTKSKQALVV